MNVASTFHFVKVVLISLLCVLGTYVSSDAANDDSLHRKYELEDTERLNQELLQFKTDALKKKISNSQTLNSQTFSDSVGTSASGIENSRIDKPKQKTEVEKAFDLARNGVQNNAIKVRRSKAIPAGPRTTNQSNSGSLDRSNSESVNQESKSTPRYRASGSGTAQSF